MAFDSLAFAPAARTEHRLDMAAALCPEWTRENPDRALALLFVAPSDCAAVDVLVSLPAKA
ncbi:MAG TPA: hypothetical protein VGB60_04200 [Brevundimonas sp.]|jgi:hypothetical protein|uniref:hypothetical protein n=1 Tax=Brevundimonas sp. TaxID=1871086 RepID=UPI002EDA9D13